MTGHPGASVPCGFTRDKPPVGLQIVGRRFEDVTVLRAAALSNASSHGLTRSLRSTECAGAHHRLARLLPA